MERVKRGFHFALKSPIVLAVVIFLLALGPRLTDLAVFVGPDEFTWDDRTANFARALANGKLIETYQDGYPGVTVMWAETVGAWLRYGIQSFGDDPADWEAVIGPNKTSMVNLEAKRQVLAVVNALIVAIYVLLIYRVFGTGVAWVAGFLLAFDPFLLTESRVLRSEAILAGFNALALLGLLLYAREPRLRYSAWVGVLTGLALLSKVSAVALLPVNVLVIVGIPLLEQKQRLPERQRLAVIAALVFGGALFLTVLALWPALWVAPLEVAWNMYNYVGVRVTEGNEGGRSFFLGRPYFQEELSALFYPVTLLYRVGPVTWLGLIFLAVMVWPMRQLSRQNKILVGILLFYLVIYLVLITRSSLKFGRFIIPMLPLLNVMAALGFVTVWQQLVRRAPKIQSWDWLMALLILVGQAALALPHHPYYQTFWNPVLGGLKQAVHVLPVGIGGEGIDQVAAYLNALPNAEALTLASGNSQKIRPILKAQTIALENLDGQWTQADYVMIYISQLQRGKHAEDILTYLKRHQPVYVAKLHGLEYAWLYPGPKAQYYGGGHKLEGRGTLFGYDLQTTTLAAGDNLTTTLYWRNEGQREDDRFFVRLMDLDGYIWAETIAQPRPGFEEANRQRLSIVESEANLTLPVGMPPGDYFFKPGFRAAQGELIGYFELPGDTKPLAVTLAQTYPPIDTVQPAHSTQLVANEDILLFGYDFTATENSLDPAFWLTLYWQALADVTHDYVILLRLLNDNQEEVAYWLGRPVRSGYPTLEWQANQIVQDPWLLTLPPEVGPGDYHLEVALFDADSEAEVGRQIIGQVSY